jgi:hypothetical protein
LKEYFGKEPRETNLFQFLKRACRGCGAEKLDRSRAGSPAVEIIDAYSPIFFDIFLHQFHHNFRDWYQVIGIDSASLPEHTAIDPCYRA